MSLDMSSVALLVLQWFDEVSLEEVMFGSRICRPLSLSANLNLMMNHSDRLQGLFRNMSIWTSLVILNSSEQE